MSARRAQELATAWPALVRPMLAIPGEVPTEPGWGYEFKWDGVRAIAYVADGELRLMSRNDLDVTRCYPELIDLAELLAGYRVVLDGEIVSLDRAGRPDFGLLQSRMHVQRPGPALLHRVPVAYFAFDLLHHDGDSLLAEPYRARRDRLAGLPLEGRSRSVAVPRWWPGWPGDGEAVLAAAREHGLEGVMAKRLDSRYQPGRRSRSWIKTALTHTMDVVVGGWKPGEGHRSGTIGSLLVGAYGGEGELRYLGHVGTGFTRRVLADLYTRLSGLETDADPFAGTVPREHARDVRWVRPLLVAEISYRGVTRDGRLRAASWRGLRPDKAPAEARTDLPPCSPRPRSAGWLLGAEPERPSRGLVHPDTGEAGGGQPIRQRGRIHRHHCVGQVQQPEHRRGDTVRAGQHAAGPQHPVRLGEQPVLPRRRGHVVQHGEAQHRGERGVGQRHGGAVALGHPHGAG